MRRICAAIARASAPGRVLPPPRAKESGPRSAPCDARQDIRLAAGTSPARRACLTWRLPCSSQSCGAITKTSAPMLACAVPAHTQSSPPRSKPPPALPIAAVFPASGKMPAAQTSVPAAAYVIDLPHHPIVPQVHVDRNLDLMPPFAESQFVIFMIVECGVSLAHSTTHDIYNRFRPLDLSSLQRGGMPIHRRVCSTRGGSRPSPLSGA